jgi:pimeloyl-ACP methyl ester carboxylesterase
VRRRHVVVATGAAAVFAAGCGTSVPLSQPERAFRVRGPAGQLTGTDGGSLLRTPVMLVHGLAGSSAHWDGTVQQLRQGRRTVAFDLRGHGGSDPATNTPSGYFPDALAGDIGAVADALKLKTFALVGHSIGSAVALAYAGANPQRVSGLVLIGATGVVPGEASVPGMQALRNDYARVTEADWSKLLAGAQPSTAERTRKELQRMPREAVLAIIGGVLSYDPGPALKAYTGPVLLVDTPYVDEPYALARQYPDLPRRVIEGASHWPQLDRPRALVAVLEQFLGQFAV